MLISLIVAADEANGIGKDGGIPWRVRSDMQRFKQLTMGHALIVGRKTWESIARPLPGRRLIVISRQLAWHAPGVEAAPDLPTALHMAQSAGEIEAFIGGGAQIFVLALPLAQRLHFTRVHTIAGCDTFFPQYNSDNWEIEQQITLPAGERDEFPSTYYSMNRKAHL